MIGNIRSYVAKIATTEAVQTEWGRLVWLIGQDSVPDTEQTFGIVTIKPGMRNALHSHPNCEELLYVVSGSCEHLLADQTIHLEVGSVIRIPRGVKHWARCTSKDPMTAVICFSSGDRRTDAHEDGGGVA